MKKIIRKVFMLAVCFTSILLGSCSKQSSSSKTTFHFSLYTDPATLDPRQNGDIISSAIVYILYEGLMINRGDGSVAPSLAESYNVSEDGKKYIFHLRKQAKWSDGVAVTAEDFVYTWQSSLSGKVPCPCPYLLFPIKNARGISEGTIPVEQLAVKALDAHTLEVELENPAPHFLCVIGFCSTFPVPKHIAEKNPNWYQAKDGSLVTNGPFQLVHWKPNQEVLVQRNPHYYNQEHVYVDQIQASIIPDQNTAFHMYEKGQLDWMISTTNPFPRETLKLLKKRADFSQNDIGATKFITFNMKKEFFQNANIRKALSSCIHRKELIHSVAYANHTVGSRIIPPVMLGGAHADLIENHQIEKAKAYLEQGLKELSIEIKQLPTLKLSCGDSLDETLCVVLKDQWEKYLGVHVDIVRLDKKSHLQKIQDKNYDLGVYSWIVRINDPIDILERFKHKTQRSNHSYWEHPDFIQCLNLANQTPDPQQRLAYFFKAEKILARELPLTPLYHFSIVTLQKPHISGIEISNAGDPLLTYVKKEQKWE